MNKFFTEIKYALDHPATTLGGLFVALGSTVGLLSTIQTTAAQVALTPHASVHLVNAATQTEVSLGVAIAIGSGLAALGKSLLKSDEPIETNPIPPPEGTPLIIPFPQAAIQPQPPLMDQQKKAA